MSKRILVADDEPDVVQVVSAILSTKGYEIEVARDGMEALQRIEKVRPDLLLVDLMMPVVSGLEVVRRVKRGETTKDLPIIVMSAAARDSGKSEEFFREGLGADDFISKPFDPLNLLGRVEAVLRMRDYASSKESRSESSGRPATPSAAKKGGVTLDQLPTLGPGEIVKAFVESWNTGDFAVEYQCLASNMKGDLPQRSYVMRRQQAFADSMAENRTQRMKQVLDMSSVDDTARVVIEREDSVQGRATRHQEAYELVRGENNWLIRAVRRI
jgi:CheY-like chemotaxis protein